MYVKEYHIKCGQKIFRCIEFSFLKDSADTKILASLTKKATELAKKVNSTLARDSQYNRSYENKLKDCMGGVIAEYCWRTWLNNYFKNNEISAKANETIFQDIKNQIDIEIVYETGETKTIEVRSSFAYKGVNAAVCRNFKIIGPYYNLIKKVEYLKDYHVMAIYSFNKNVIFDELKSLKFKIYLTGGATKELLKTSPYSSDEELSPWDEISATPSKAIYKVIKPIVNGLDTIEISESIAKYNFK